MRNSVVLPQPDGPTTTQNSPGATLRWMLRIASIQPVAVSNRRPSPAMWMSGAVVGPESSAGSDAGAMAVRPSFARAVKPAMCCVGSFKSESLSIGEPWSGGAELLKRAFNVLGIDEVGRIDVGFVFELALCSEELLQRLQSFQVDPTVARVDRAH